MINTDYLENLGEAVDTLYTAARNELFRPLDQFTRWRAEDGISDAEFGLHPRDTGKIKYDTMPVDADALTAWGAANPQRALLLQRIRDVTQALALEAVDSIDELRAIVMKTRGVSKTGVVKERLFLRVEIDWEDDTLVREYAL